MTNFSKSASCSINDAIKLVKEISTDIDKHVIYTEERMNAQLKAIEYAAQAIEHTLEAIEELTKRVKELEAK